MLKRKEKMEAKKFRVGNEVEVFYVVRLRGTEVGGWVSAAILEDFGSEVEVETRMPLQRNRMKMRVGPYNIRPQPPLEEENDRIFEEGQVIEIRLFDLWIIGKVWEVLHGTANVSYSVHALDTYWLDQRIYSVSMSQVRVLRQWVDGKWVPSPRLPLHHQVYVVLPIKIGDSFAILRDHSSEQWRSKGKTAIQLEDPQFSIGSEVEIYENFMDGWKHATIEELQGDQIRVQYKVWSWIEHFEHDFDKFYDASLARPVPPKIRDEKVTFNLHQEVEVYDCHFGACGGFWCRGEVVEIHRNMFDKCFYSISRLKRGIINVKETDLRVRREWVDGQWVQPQSDLHVEQPLKQRTAPAIGSEVEVYSSFYKGWIPVTIMGSTGNQIVVEARMMEDDETKNWRLYLDMSRMRPRPSVEKHKNWIFEETDIVEVLQLNGCWQKGEIWEVHGTSKDLFYSVKAMREDCIKLFTVSKSKVRVRRNWVVGNWSDSSFEQPSSSPSSPELIRRDGALDKRRKVEDAQFCIGAEVEVFNNSMGGWEPGSVMALQGKKIGVQVERKLVPRQKFSDASLVRPKPPVMKEGNHQKFQLHDEVEALDDKIWCVGQILEVLGRGDMLFYCVSHPRKGCSYLSEQSIRVHLEWRDGKWIRSHSDSPVQQLLKETHIDETRFIMGAEVEVYSFKSHGWLSATILQLCNTYIEVATCINNEKWINHVDASRIRPRPPLEVHNDQIFNCGGLIEVRSGFYKSWQKGEIWGIRSKQKLVFYSILDSDGMIVVVPKSYMRVCQKWVHGKWIFPSFGTSLQPEYLHQMSIHNVDAEPSQPSERLDEGEAIASQPPMKPPTEALFKSTPSKTLEKPVVEQHDVAIPTAEAGTVNANMLVHVRPSIKIRRTRSKTDITWNYCQILAHPRGKARILKCNFCGQTYYGGGIHRMKEHLAHREKGDARPCLHVPSSVRDQIQRDLKMITKEEKVKQGYASKENQSKDHLYASSRSHTKTISVRSDSTSMSHEGNQSTESSGKQLAEDDAPTSCQELEEDEFDDITGDVVEEGNTKAGPTGTEAHSRLVDGQENQDIDVERVPPTHPSTKHIKWPCLVQTISEQSDSTSMSCEENQNTESSGKQLAEDVAPTSCQGLEEDEFDDTIGDTVKEGHTKAGPTGTEAHSKLVDGQENMDVDVERVPTTHPSTKHIIDMALQGYALPSDMQHTFDLLSACFGDIFRNCIVVGAKSRLLWTYELFGVVKQMEDTTYENVTIDMIDKWYTTCLDHKTVKIDNEWLMNRIEDLRNIVIARMDASKLENSCKKINEEIEKIGMDAEQLMRKKRELTDEFQSVSTKMKIAIEKSKVSCNSQSLINELY